MLTIKDAILPVLTTANRNDVALIWILLELGKTYNEKIEELTDAEGLTNGESYEQQVLSILMAKYNLTSRQTVFLANEIPSKLNEAFLKGGGLLDNLLYRDNNYCGQLEVAILSILNINKVGSVVKGSGQKEWLARQKQVFKSKVTALPDSLGKAIKLEGFLIGFLLGAYIRKLPTIDVDTFRENCRTALEQYASSKGVELEVEKILGIILRGNVNILGYVSGYDQPQLLWSIIRSLNSDSTNVGVSFTPDFTLENNSSTFLNAGKTLLNPTIFFNPLAILGSLPQLANPRRYDKFVPAVIQIYFLRFKERLSAL